MIHRRYNPEGITQYNIVPGLIAVILTMTMVMVTAMAMTREREKGTFENLLAMPASPFEVMIGKITPYVVVGYIQATLILLGACYVFDVPMIGSLTLACGDRWIVHRGQSRAWLHLLDDRQEPASGDADDGVLPAAVDPAVGLHVPVPGHAELGAMDRAKRCPTRISCASCGASCSRGTARPKSGPASGRS